MSIEFFNKLIVRVFGKRSLRTVLIVPLLVQVFAVVGLVGYLSFRNGQRAVKDVATQLLEEVSDRVEQNLQAYLIVPHQINQINATAIRLGQLNIQDLAALERHFWQQIQIFDTITFVGLGLENQENLGAERLDDGTLTLRISTKESGYIFRTYALNSSGDRQNLLDSIKFDPRTRPWYKAGVAARKATWSEIYPNTAGITSYLGASLPFYDDRGKLQGVLLTNINLSQIGKFLHNLRIGKNGQAFIIERSSGMLVATSTGEKPFRTLNKDYGAERVSVTESSNDLTKATAQYLTTHVNYQNLLKNAQQLEFERNGKRYFVQIQPFQDRFGLDWAIFVVVPEADFIKQIHANTRTTIALLIIALAVATALAILISRWILQPILRLNTAAKAIAKGQWEQTVEVERTDELGELAESFNRMAVQLRESFVTLEAKNAELQRTKDAIAQSNRSLEQKVSDRTQELAQTLEILKATQAELVFENALLRSVQEPTAYHYQVGGSLPMDAPTYVVRSADRLFYKALQQGDFCYVFNGRQVGKSSLMVRMMRHLQQEGYLCVAIDMTRIGGKNITLEQWYKGLVVELWQGFNLLGKVNLKTWWNENQNLYPVQRLGQFIEEILLGEVGVENDLAKPSLVIFIDEIDSVFGLDFCLNDFFALIRSCYNQRSLNREYQRLTFALFGVANPSDLMRDYRRTPFNIGRAIQLDGFKMHEAQPLLQGLSERVNHPQLVLKEILAWTNGQPFLTQKLCKLIASTSTLIPASGEAAWIEQLVRTHIIENWEFQDEPEHLRTIRDRILRNERQAVKILKLYQNILEQEEIAAFDSAEVRELLLSGLVIRQSNVLKVNNRIYRTIFDRHWVEKNIGAIDKRYSSN
ncbi:HAMP domain-containing protein [Candidatus Gracilibacteria bacterium]|nr:HAMP domain-containing protein [Candidatus Gracilibacteria bacterium]NJM88894.1 HAMP domain-containing protein [Hydrococcus sp. RU_2_2]NJP19868.1 HAMP domain-containing protein [Hydrococcus sp. CRU_1_1]